MQTSCNAKCCVLFMFIYRTNSYVVSTPWKVDLLLDFGHELLLWSRVPYIFTSLFLDTFCTQMKRDWYPRLIFYWANHFNFCILKTTWILIKHMAVEVQYTLQNWGRLKGNVSQSPNLVKVLQFSKYNTTVGVNFHWKIFFLSKSFP